MALEHRGEIVFVGKAALCRNLFERQSGVGQQAARPLHPYFGEVVDESDPPELLKQISQMRRAKMHVRGDFIDGAYDFEPRLNEFLRFDHVSFPRLIIRPSKGQLQEIEKHAGGPPVEEGLLRGIDRSRRA